MKKLHFQKKVLETVASGRQHQEDNQSSLFKKMLERIKNLNSKSHLKISEIIELSLLLFIVCCILIVIIYKIVCKIKNRKYILRNDVNRSMQNQMRMLQNRLECLENTIPDNDRGGAFLNRPSISNNNDSITASPASLPDIEMQLFSARMSRLRRGRVDSF